MCTICDRVFSWSTYFEFLQNSWVSRVETLRNHFKISLWGRRFPKPEYVWWLFALAWVVLNLCTKLSLPRSILERNVSKLVLGKFVNFGQLMNLFILPHGITFPFCTYSWCHWQIVWTYVLLLYFWIFI